MSTKKTKMTPTEKEKKPKLVRDSFTIPKDEYLALDSLKERALQLGVAVKKSELLRAGLMALGTMNDASFKAALAGVPALKTGRPSKEDSETAATAQAPSAKPATATPQKLPKAPVAAKRTPAPATKRVSSKSPAGKTPVKRVQA